MSPGTINDVCNNCGVCEDSSVREALDMNDTPGVFCAVVGACIVDRALPAAAAVDEDVVGMDADSAHTPSVGRPPGPYRGSPTSGWPIAAVCMRI